MNSQNPYHGFVTVPPPPTQISTSTPRNGTGELTSLLIHVAELTLCVLPQLQRVSCLACAVLRLFCPCLASATFSGTTHNAPQMPTAQRERALHSDLSTISLHSYRCPFCRASVIHQVARPWEFDPASIFSFCWVFGFVSFCNFKPIPPPLSVPRHCGCKKIAFRIRYFTCFTASSTTTICLLDESPLLLPPLNPHDSFAPAGRINDADIRTPRQAA